MTHPDNNRQPLVVFFDPKSGRGGGQVVLEELLARLVGETSLALVMPIEGRDSIAIPEGVRVHNSRKDFLVAVEQERPVLLVANANASLPDLLRSARSLRRREQKVRTVAIIHNYPSSKTTERVTRWCLSHVDLPIAVEPGLTVLSANAAIPSWLSVIAAQERVVLKDVSPTGAVKSYARPDRSKGLHLLPEIFAALETAGLTCRVALGVALDRQDSYASKLREDLAPWLESGSRNSAWIEPGDIFIVPSIAGEAACLSAQEAMSRGAIVVASRIGLMAYLSPINGGIRTFPVGDTDAATRAVLQVASWEPDVFAAQCRAASDLARDRAGRWYEEVTEMVVEQAAGLLCD